MKGSPLNGILTTLRAKDNGNDACVPSSTGESAPWNDDLILTDYDSTLLAASVPKLSVTERALPDSLNCPVWSVVDSMLKSTNDCFVMVSSRGRRPRGRSMYLPCLQFLRYYSRNLVGLLYIGVCLYVNNWTVGDTSRVQNDFLKMERQVKSVPRQIRFTALHCSEFVRGGAV